MAQECLVCSGTQYIALYNETLKKCNGCGFVTANMQLQPGDLERIYSANYFKGEEYLDYVKEKNALQFNFKKRLKYIQKKLPSVQLSNVFEIGCAYGFFAQTINNEFPNIKYTGIDVVKEAIDYGKSELGQNLVCHDYLTFKPNEKFADVFMWDVIEHLEHPQKFIEKIANELEKNGRLYITTGDIDALLPRIQKQKWRMIHPPSHLHYFSQKTLCQLLEKYEFSIKFVNYPPVYRSIKQIFYSLFILNKPDRKLFNKIFSSIPELWQLPINTYDIMFVCATKK